MKLIVAGSRGFNKRDIIYEVLDTYLVKYPKDLEIVSGMAKGPDKIGADWAVEHKIPVKEFRAQWGELSEPCEEGINRYGKKFNRLAGFNRNTKMAEYADALLAFWDGKSRGTSHMISEAKRVGIPIRIILNGNKFFGIEKGEGMV